MRIRYWGLLVGALLIGFSLAAHAKDYVLDLNRLHLQPGERIVGLKMHVSNLNLLSMSSVPNGWTFTINTDAADKVDIAGAIIVGAAALDPLEVAHEWIFRTPVSPVLDDPPDLRGTITVTKTFEDSRKIPLNDKMLVAKPSK